MGTTEATWSVVGNTGTYNNGIGGYADSLGALTSWSGPSTFTVASGNSTSGRVCWATKH